jgi:hypothetical protein
MPMIGIEGGRINIVPVDFVADALDHIAHKKGLDGKCFHLTDPAPHRIGEVLNIFAKAAHAPQMTMRVNARMFGFIPAPILYGLGSVAPVKRMVRAVLKDLGIPHVPPDIGIVEIGVVHGEHELHSDQDEGEHGKERSSGAQPSAEAGSKIDVVAGRIDWWLDQADRPRFSFNRNGHLSGAVFNGAIAFPQKAWILIRALTSSIRGAESRRKLPKAARASKGNDTCSSTRCAAR